MSPLPWILAFQGDARLARPTYGDGDGGGEATDDERSWAMHRAFRLGHAVVEVAVDMARGLRSIGVWPSSLLHVDCRLGGYQVSGIWDGLVNNACCACGGARGKGSSRASFDTSRMDGCNEPLPTATNTTTTSRHPGAASGWAALQPWSCRVMHHKPLES